MVASGISVQNDYHHDTHQDSRKGAEDYRRIELISGTTRRRRWSDDERARILAESFEPGANVSAVARRYGVSGGLLHCWRKHAKALAKESVATDRPTFVPVAISEAASDAKTEVRRLAARMIEIETAGARVRVPTGADPETLSVILAALRRAP
jgi:transposase